MISHRPKNPIPRILGLLLVPILAMAADYQPATIKPPAPTREFRGTWIASVYNLDWPSRPGLPVTLQRRELKEMLDQAAALHLNAVILQVRPACDALYASPYEPWSYFLTGKSGLPPEPFYDPLAYAIEEAHKRGLELHAWVNPFRARVSQDLYVAPTHVAKVHPEWIRRYGDYSWLDPGVPAVREYTRNVILDIVRRYDVDGIHIDDYFYPYPDGKKKREFDDWDTWKAYRAGGGKLNLSDWRRENINRFVKSLYDGIKAEKKWVKFGVSPFGIWRPNTPTGIKAGIDAYEDLAADSRLWFKSGWLDYFTPQLYWTTDSSGQSFTKLIKWWAGENSLQRHLWPGIATERVGRDRDSAEIIKQVELSRSMSAAGTAGQIHWNFKALRQNRGGVAKRLAGGVYSSPALVPGSPWLSSEVPAKPAAVLTGGTNPSLSWSSQGTQPGKGASSWLLQWQDGSGWHQEILPAEQRNRVFSGVEAPKTVALSAVNRYGTTGPAMAWTLKPGSSQAPPPAKK